MRLACLSLFCAFTQVGFSQVKEDVAFFEERYKAIISGVKPIEEYGDPDSYYKDIATQLGVFGKAYYAVFKKYGWTKGPNKAHSGKLTRADGTNRWEIMVVQTLIDPVTKKADMRDFKKNLKMKLVFLYDDGRVEFPKLLREGKKSEKP